MNLKIALIATLLACAALTSCGPASPGNALNLNFTPLGYTREKSLADYRGRIVVVTLWATWCPYCRGELPALDALARRHDSSRVVNMILSDEDERKLQSYAPLQQTRLMVGRIDRAQAGILPSARPVTFILDREGVVVDVLRGAQSFEVLEAALQPVLAAN